MPQSPEPLSPGLIHRFSSMERAIHLTLAVLMGVGTLTAAILYWGSLGNLVGRRDIVKTLHFTAGLLLPLPLLIGALASPSFRADARRLNRFVPGDRDWLLARDRRGGSYPSGKFNAGQKLYAAVVLGAVLVMALTGLMMHYYRVFPDDLRAGATLVHDAFAAVIVIVSAGHLWMAWRDPQARRGMRTGYVARSWAEREHASWAVIQPVEPDGPELPPEAG